MIRNLLFVSAALLLTSCASNKPQPAAPPDIIVSPPVNLVFVEIADALLTCPDILDSLVLPVPDAAGTYAASDVDRTILEVYRLGTECGRNMRAVRDIYLSAKKTYEKGEGVE